MPPLRESATKTFNSRVQTTIVLAWELARASPLELVLFALAFKVLDFVLLAPLATWVMRLFLQRWGRASVGNFEIANFLLSPIGLVSICCVGGIAIATLYLEITGLMQIMLNPKFRWWFVSGRYVHLYQKLLRLGGIQLAVVLAIALPCVGLIGLIYAIFLSGRDLNGLLILKPAEFWWAVGLAVVVAIPFLAIAVTLLMRWLIAVPIVLCEPKVSPLQALRQSRESSRSHLALLFTCLFIWFVAQTLVTTSALAIVHFGLEKLLDVQWQTLSTAAFFTGVAMCLEWLLGMSLSIVANIGFAALTLALYHSIANLSIQETRSRLFPAGHVGAEIISSSVAPQYSRMLAVLLIGLLGIAIGVSYWICDTLVLRDRIAITAHRAGAAYAPENTIAAIQRAIEDKADWAEIDVQITADSELVVMHDTDLARVGGGNGSVGKATLQEIHALDVGSLHSAEFAGERIPRFADLLLAAKDRIRLNVELKPHGTSDTEPLTRQVVAAILQAGMINQCRICSQSYASIQLARSIEPKIEIGFIVATSIGDSTKLNVNYLMLSHSKITRQVVERARARGIEIHAWTVNDPALVLNLIDDGVSNIITDDTPLIAQQLKEIELLHPVERLLLRAKNGVN